MPSLKVTVVGAGIAGLTAAQRLAQRGIRAKILETAPWPGGRMAERQAQGMTYNTGARLCYSFYPALLELVRELGLEDAIIRHGNMQIRCRTADSEYVLPLKPGLNLLIHHELPWREKLAMLRLLPDLLRAWRRVNPGWMITAKDFDEQTLAEYLREKVGPVFLEKFVEPVFRCTRSWNTDEVSPALFISTSSRLMPGSFTFGFREGIGQLTKALAEKADIEYQTEVFDISRREEGKGCLVRYRQEGVEKELESDIVLCAVQGSHLPALVESPVAEEETFFSSIRYNPLGVIHARVTSNETAGVTFFARECSSIISIVEFARQGELLKLYCQMTPEQSRKLQEDGNTEDLYAVIREELFNHCPGLTLDEESIVNQWIESKIPLFYPGYIKNVQTFQDYQEAAPHRIYYCGDYLAQALVEGACQSGNHIAATIARHWLNAHD